MTKPVCHRLRSVYGSGHEGASILLPGFAIKWQQNKVTTQPHLRDLTHMGVRNLWGVKSTLAVFLVQCWHNNNNNNNGPNGHLFYVGGNPMMRRGMLPIIMLPDGDLRIVLQLVPFWILTIWGSVHIEETVVGWRNQLRMKTSIT